MATLLLATALAVAAVVVAAVVQRARSLDAPTQPSWTAPSQLDRADFERRDAPWLVAVFSSSSCRSCEEALAAARALATSDVAVTEVEAAKASRLHRRYHVEAVPITVIAGADGVVRASFVGPVSEDELASALETCRRFAPRPGGDAAGS